MAAIGKKVPGWKKPGPFYVEQVPISCLDGCPPTEGHLEKKHKIVDACCCTPGFRCAMHELWQSMLKAYPQDDLFT